MGQRRIRRQEVAAGECWDGPQNPQRLQVTSSEGSVPKENIMKKRGEEDNELHMLKANYF